MRAGDRWLQSWRIAKAKPFIRRGARVLDVGCHDGALFRRLGDRIVSGVGVDSDLPPVRWESEGLRYVAGRFPDALGEERPFDVITMLAVLEHLPNEELGAVAQACARHLVPGGCAVATVPSPLVDPILDVLRAVRIVDGMSLEEHHEMDPSAIPDAFAAAGFRVAVARRFQLGLNNLYVFERVAASG
jgi:2-polyprenyl-3-methyl-5-hydroxy-6-metoxy-1,4-benzoquinol methylase